MSNFMKNRTLALGSLLFGVVLTFVGCEPKGPAEKAGESIDKGIQSAKDTVNPPGTMEKAGRAADKALKH